MVDCSAVVDSLVVADAHDLSVLLSTRRLNAPHLIDVEVVSAARGLTLGRHMTHHWAEDVLGSYAQLPLTRWGSAAEQLIDVIVR